MIDRIKRFVAAGFIVGIALFSLSAPATAAYFEVTLSNWSGRTWVAAGNKSASAKSFYVEVAKDSPNGGHFWVDDANGHYIGDAIDVDAGQSKWGAYQGTGRSYGGYATLYGRERGHGPFFDFVKGWQNLNG